MAPWTIHSGSSQHGEQPDLSTLLTAPQREELTLLIANITEVMRKQINKNFSIPTTTTKPKELLAKDAKNPNISDKAEPHKETDEEEKSRKQMEKRLKELSAPKQQELKNAALEYLQNWQTDVITRVGEVVNSKETAEKQQEEAKASATDVTPEAAPPPDKKVITSQTNTEDADAALIELYPPTSTTLYSLPKEKKIQLLHIMLLLLLSLEHYPAQSRILLLHIASSLHLPLHILAEHESQVAQGLVAAAKNMSGDEETKNRSEENKVARRWKVGIAGVAGAALIGVTGGLAAPLVATGIGAVLGGLGLEATVAAGLLGSLAESSIIVGSLFGLYGGMAGGKMMDAYAKEVQDFAFLPLRGKKKSWSGIKDAVAEDRRLRVSIGTSGWLTQKEDVVTPWRVLGHQSEVFALRWELEALMKLGTSMESVVKTAAWSVAKKEIIARTIFASLMEALWPLAVLRVSKIVDNPFSVAMSRADKAGLVLADALIAKVQGERPVTLIGYSLGARMIYICLMSLAERKAFGLIESVVLIGTPAPSDAAVWRSMRTVVAGRLVNVYSENDYILAFLYRTSAIQYGIAGISEIPEVNGIENVNVSEMVSGHLRYQYLVGSILEKIGWEDIDIAEVAKEEETLALLEEEEEKEKEKNGGKGEMDENDLQKEVDEKTNQNLLQKGMSKLHLG